MKSTELRLAKAYCFPLGHSLSAYNHPRHPSRFEQLGRSGLNVYHTQCLADHTNHLFNDSS